MIDQKNIPNGMKFEIDSSEKGNNEKATLSKKDKVCRKIIEGGILGLIVFSPLPAASVYGWSILVIQLVVFVMLLSYIFMTDKPKANDSLIQSLKWPSYLFAGLFAVIFLQMVPFPKFLQYHSQCRLLFRFV